MLGGEPEISTCSAAFHLLRSKRVRTGGRTGSEAGMIALELAWSSANEECVRATKPGREVRKWKGSSNATSGRAPACRS